MPFAKLLHESLQHLRAPFFEHLIADCQGGVRGKNCRPPSATIAGKSAMAISVRLYRKQFRAAHTDCNLQSVSGSPFVRRRRQLPRGSAGATCFWSSRGRPFLLIARSVDGHLRSVNVCDTSLGKDQMEAPWKNIADILCIGCQKGSTRWLQSLLATHPDTWSFPDTRPQPSTDNAEGRAHEPGVDWRHGLMKASDPRLKTMDFSPEYACLPDHYIAECKRLNPDAKVLYILRDPVARAVSALRTRMQRHFGPEAHARLDMGLMLEMLPDAGLNQHGAFMQNLEAWKKHYPDMLVLNYEELHGDRATSIARIMEHVGLDPARLTGEHRARFNAIMAGKIWKSRQFPVERDVLMYLHGLTWNARMAVREALGFEFTEGTSVMDAESAPPVPHQPANDLTSLQTVLEQIRDEIIRNREVTSAQSKTLGNLLAEVRGERRMTRMMLESSTADMEAEIATVLGQVQLDMAQTLEAVHAKRLSLARYGDGELMLMANEGHSIQFQRNSSDLRRDLINAVNPDWLAPGRVMVALPPPFRGSLLWLGVWIRTWSLLNALIDPAQRYGHTLVTRPAFFQQQGDAGIGQWRRLWQDREVLVVTGRGSRFDLLPALFDGAAKIDFLYTASEHAFEERDEIMKGVVKRAKPDTIVLLSLGPTATILAHRIAAAGIQALDIGHISASYAYVRSNGLLPERMQTSRKPATIS